MYYQYTVTLVEKVVKKVEIGSNKPIENLDDLEQEALQVAFEGAYEEVSREEWMESHTEEVK